MGKLILDDDLPSPRKANSKRKNLIVPFVQQNSRNFQNHSELGSYRKKDLTKLHGFYLEKHVQKYGSVKQKSDISQNLARALIASPSNNSSSNNAILFSDLRQNEQIQEAVSMIKLQNQRLKLNDKVKYYSKLPSLAQEHERIERAKSVMKDPNLYLRALENHRRHLGRYYPELPQIISRHKIL